MPTDPIHVVGDQVVDQPPAPMVDPADDSRARLARRAVLKRAAAAGAIAWTAPVILDSVSARAFAVTPSGCSGCDDVSTQAITYTPSGATQGGAAYAPKGGPGTFTPCATGTVTVQAWGGGG